MSTEQIELLKFISTIIVLAGSVLSALLIWGVKAWISASFKNTTAVEILTDKIMTMTKDVVKIPKLESDVNHLHGWRREHLKDHDMEL